MPHGAAGTVPSLMGDTDPKETRGTETPRYDVVVVSDFTVGGDLGGETAAEIRASAAAGYTIGLVAVDGPVGAHFDQRVASCVRRGLADLLLPRERVSARLLVLRLAPDLERPPTWRVAVEAERVVVVLDASHAADRDLVAGIDEEVATRCGSAPEWIATSDAARTTITRMVGDRSGRSWTWGPVVEVSPAPRPMPEDRRPAIAWYRRGAVTGAGWVRTLVSPARRRLARAWPVLDLDGSAPVLVADLDVVVTYDVPDPAAPPDRVLLEALGAGAIVVVPPAARPVFGDACVYAEPSAVVRAVRRLLARREEWERASRAALEHATERFGVERHVDHLRELVGEPTNAPLAPGAIRPRLRRRRAMFVSSNGAGVGHLTRLLAVARRLPDDVEPIFFTMSQAVSVVRRMGYPCEYLASAGYTGMEAGTWNRHLQSRLTELVAEYGPEVVVFDGTHPYRGLLDVARTHPHVQFVWSRRAMWKEGAGRHSVVTSAGRVFTLVIEPGELAEEVDCGLTVGFRHEAVRVAPVTLLDRSELLTREEARAELGLDPDRPAVLVQLGAGNIDDAASVSAIVHEQLRQVGGLQVCATSHPISKEGQPESPDLHVVSVYPLSRYLAAFDFGITAPGYNSFHEFVSFGVPAIFIANTKTSVDDQAARGRWAEQVGAGLCIESFTPGALASALEQMLDSDRREAMRRSCDAHARANGAREAADVLDRLLAPVATAPGASRLEQLSVLESSRVSRLDALVSTIRSRLRTNPLVRRLTGRAPLAPGEARSAAAAGRAGALPVLAGRPVKGARAGRLPVALLLCLGAGEQEVTRLVKGIAELQAEQRSFRPLFVVDSDHFASFRANDYLFEYVVPREEWESLTGAGDWPVYLERRLKQIVGAFLPSVVVDVSPTDGMDRVDGKAALLGALGGVSEA